MAKAVCVPMKLDAFVLNEDVCQGQSRLAPITQPEFAQLDPSNNNRPRHDILPHHDLAYSSPASINPRVTDLTTGELRKNRFGIYLSWCLPRPFRSGYAATESAKDRVQKERNLKGLPPLKNVQNQHANPEVILSGGTWIVVRQLAVIDRKRPRPGKSGCEVFIVESDRVRSLADFSAGSDIEIEATPLLDPTKPLQQQGQSFVGWVVRNHADLEQYKSTNPSPTKGHHVPLTVMSTSNIYMPDYQPHHAGVFSIHDDLSDVWFLHETEVSYFVMGYYAKPEKPQNVSNVIDPLVNYGNDGSTIDGNALLKAFRMSVQMPTSKLHEQDMIEIGTWKKDAQKPSVMTVCHGALYNVKWDSRSAPKKRAAEDFAELLLSSHPIAIGTNTIDCLIAFARAATDSISSASEKSAASFLLRKLQGFMVRTADDVDSQFEAADLIESLNVVPSTGGVTWHVKKVDGSTQPPSYETLVEINQLQELLNQKSREVEHLRQLLFCQWWKFYSYRDANGEIDDSLKNSITFAVTETMLLLTSYNNKDNSVSIDNLKRQIVEKSGGLSIESAAAPSFAIQRDSVISFASIKTGWPSGWHEDVKVRIKGTEESTYIFDEADFDYIKAKLNSYDKVSAPYFTEDNLWRWINAKKGIDLTFLPPRHVLGPRGIEVYVSALKKLLNSSRPHHSTLVNHNWQGAAYSDSSSEPWLEKFKSLSLDLNKQITAFLFVLKHYFEDIFVQHQADPVLWENLWATMDMIRAVHNRCKMWGVPLEDRRHPELIDVLDRGKVEFMGFGRIEKTATGFGGDPLKETIFQRYKLDLTDYKKRLDQLSVPEIRDKLRNATKFDAPEGMDFMFQELFFEWLFGHGLEDFGRNVSPYTMLHDRWDGQPFFPYVVEWKAEYYHVPWEHWTFAPSGLDKIVSWKIKSEVDVSTIQKDISYLTGRSFILPEAPSQLKTMVTRLINTMHPENLHKTLSEQDQKTLWMILDELPFLSTSMDGFKEQLATLRSGNHIKPTYLSPDTGLPEVAGKSKQAAEEVGLTAEVLKLIGSQTDLTPMANSSKSGQFSAFKPVTHGQLRFTELNVIDKFGQVVCCIDPARPTEQNPLKPLYPCISEQFSCSPVDATAKDPVANTVIRDAPGHCQFVQIPPRINQPARWNAHFLRFTSGAPQRPWKMMYEWENPMWGIIVINYIDRSLQIFTGDGVFVAEYAVGGIKNLGSGVRYRPWQPITPADQQLRQFVGLLSSNAEYRLIMYDMIANAIGNLPHSPNNYADALPAVLGKPIALVNMAWSLELATPCLESQLLGDRLLEKTLYEYEFPLKLGDKDVSYDGLIGYFHELGLEPSGLDLKSPHTYFSHNHPEGTPEPTDATNVETIYRKWYKDMEPYSSFKPYYVELGDDKPDVVARKHLDQLKVFGALVDPFTPVHGYSGILPSKQLAVPAWAVSKAIKSMTGFFAMGPILVPDNVRPVDVVSNPVLPPSIPVEGGRVVNPADPVKRTLQVPSAGVGSWEWLQPSYGEHRNTPIVGGAGVDGKTFYESMQLGFLDQEFGLREGPLSAVEGYLMLKKAT